MNKVYIDYQVKLVNPVEWKSVINIGSQGFTGDKGVTGYEGPRGENYILGQLGHSVILVILVETNFVDYLEYLINAEDLKVIIVSLD